MSLPLDVSVIIPAYRAEATIGRALRSVVAQTSPPREVIVVDDGSSDGTSATAEACRTGMGDITLKVVRQQNAGAGAARNRAVREASSTFVAFLDADDEWLPEKLERSFEVMEKKNLALVAHNYLAVETDGSVSPANCAAIFQEGVDPIVTLFRKGYLSTATLITRRDVVFQAGGFDEGLRNAQDFDLWLAILGDGEVRFEVFDDILMRYHVTAGSNTTNTGRRVRCGMEIALRFAPGLKDRPGGIYRNLWLRTLIIHAEAIQAHRSRGELLSALAMLLRCPIAVLGATFKCLSKTGTTRPSFLSQEHM